MSLLAGSISHGQAVALIILCIFLIVFIVADIYLVLFLRRKNKRLAQNTHLTYDSENEGDDTITTVNEGQD